MVLAIDNAATLTAVLTVNVLTGLLAYEPGKCAVFTVFHAC